MFPGCPEHCNAEGTLSEYSRNTAWRLGIFVTPKITYSYWFITILIFSILKMIIFSLYLKISSIISLIAFFCSLKTFLIFLSSQSLISSFFSIKKMFLMSNCSINCFFFSFFWSNLFSFSNFQTLDLYFSSLFVLKKNNYFLKNKSPLYSLKHFKILVILSNTKILLIMQIIIKLTSSIFIFSNNLFIIFFTYMKIS